MSYEVLEIDKQILLGLCGLTGGQELPPEVEEAYWEYKRYFDRAFSGQRLSPDALVRLAMVYKPGEPQKEEYDPVPTVVDLWERGEIKAGDPVRARYRNRDHDGFLISVQANGEKCLVQIGDDERNITPKFVTVPLSV